MLKQDNCCKPEVSWVTQWVQHQPELHCGTCFQNKQTNKQYFEVLSFNISWVWPPWGFSEPQHQVGRRHDQTASQRPANDSILLASPQAGSEQSERTWWDDGWWGPLQVVEGERTMKTKCKGELQMWGQGAGAGTSALETAENHLKLSLRNKPSLHTSVKTWKQLEETKSSSWVVSKTHL